MNTRTQRLKNGFTIVELLIVIVVIGILAALTIVAFNGVRVKAIESSLKSDLNNAKKIIQTADITTSTFPVDTSTLKASNGGSYSYTYNDTAETFCLSETIGTISYYITESTTPAPGLCPVANIVTWSNANNSAAGNWATAAISTNGQYLVASNGGSNPGTLKTSSDGGATWTVRNGAGSNAFHASMTISSDGQKIITLKAGNAAPMRSTDNGATWSTLTFPGTNNSPRQIIGSNDGNLLVVGTMSNIYTSVDAGVTWVTRTPLPVGSGGPIDIAMSDNGQYLYAVGNGNGKLYYSTNLGASWVVRGDWSSVETSSDGSKVTGLNGTSVRVSTDYAATSSLKATLPANADILSTSADGTKMIATYSFGAGFVYTSVNSGDSWQESTAIGSQTWRHVLISGDGSKLVALRYSVPIYTGIFN